MRSSFLRRMSGVAFALVGVWLAGAVAEAQNFLQPTVIPTGNWPAAVYAVDVNGDGIPDLIYVDQGAVANSPSTTHVLLGDGKGNFAESAKIATVGSALAFGGVGFNQAFSIFWGQTVGSAVQVYRALGRGDGTFYAPFQATAFGSAGLKTPQVGYLAIGRLRTPNVGATKYSPQILVEDVANNLVYAIVFNPDGSVVPTVAALPDGPGPLYLTPAPTGPSVVSGLIVANAASGTAQIFALGQGFALQSSPPTQPAVRFKGVRGMHSLIAQDVNNDGQSDLIVEGAAGHIDVFAGNGNGTFQSTPFLGSGALDGTTGNGGHLIGGTTLGAAVIYAATPIGVSSLLESGGTNLTLKGIYNAGPGRTSYAIADFNRDGVPDIAVDSPEGIAILFGNPDGSFQTGKAFAAGQPAMSSAVGGFTASGNRDVVVSTGAAQAQLLLGKGDGTFAYVGSPGAPVPTTTATGAAGLWSSVFTGDFNGDGNFDLLLSADGPASATPPPGNGLSFQAGDGKGGFELVTALNPPAYASLCPGALAFGYGPTAVADFNGDYLPDFVTRDSAYAVVFDSHNGLVPQLAGGYPQAATPTCQTELHNLAVAGAFTTPLRPDMWMEEAGHLLLYPNSGTGIFKYPSLGDLAVDGSLTTPGQLTAPLLSGTFNGPAVAVASGGLGFPAAIGSATVADLDQSGNNDLLVTYANLAADRTAPTTANPNYLYIWYGSGNGKFLTSQRHPVNPVRMTLSRNYYQVLVADMNGDTIPDLILSDGYIVNVQLGRGDGTFGAETHYLAGQGVNTISIADLNHDGTLDLAIADGGTTLTNPVANLEQPFASQDVNTGGVTVLVNYPTQGSQTPTVTGSLTASPEPTTYGSAFTLTATLTGVGSSAPPTGTVSFAIDGTAIGSANLSGGVGTIAIPSNVYATLAVGTHALTGSYSGDGTFAPYGSLTGTHVVTKIPTTMDLLLCVDPPGSNFPCGNPISATPLISPISMYYGQSVDGVAIESATTLTGTITFYSGTRVFCTLNANLKGGSNTCPPASGYFPAGTTTVTADYSGDGEYQASNSNGIVVIVTADSTTATVTSSLNPATAGLQVTFTATVMGNFAIPVGEPVLFLDGITTIGTGTLDAAGQATMTTSTLAIGVHPITVVLPGSLNFNSVISPVLTQVITPALTPQKSAVTLTSSVNPSAPGQGVTFTATVTVPGIPGLVPTGTVTFFDGTAPLSTVTLNASGIATFATATLGTGSHAMTAAYSGAAAVSGIVPPTPVLPKPPGSARFAGESGGFRVSGPVAHSMVLHTPLLPDLSASAAQVSRFSTPEPAILAGVSSVLTQVVQVPVSTDANSFTMTVAPDSLTLKTGYTGQLIVTVQEGAAFKQTVVLSCAGMPAEATCSFVQAVVPIGGEATSLYVMTSAPRDCTTNVPYLAGVRGGTGKLLALAMPGLALLLVGTRRRRWLRAGLLMFAGLLAMGAISGCGHCTDLGTRPGTYSFTVTATPQSAGTAQVQTIPLVVTLP